MSYNKGSPEYYDDMRDLFEDSEDENVDNSVQHSRQQSPLHSTQETSSEIGQSKTKRKRSEDVAIPASLDESDQEDMVQFHVII